MQHLVDDLEQDKSPSRICLKHSGRLQIVELKDIVYLSAEGSYTTFYLSSGTQVMMSKTMKFYLDLLGTGFLRGHRSDRQSTV